MDHIAIMKTSRGLIDKILTKEKTIESRWYKAKVAPWNRIKRGDTVYFKDAGKPVTAKAEVEKVLQYEKYSEEELKNILSQYSGVGHICFTSPRDKVFPWAKERSYCILIFLKNPKKIEPFNIDKTGYGSACAWMCVGDIKKVKRFIEF